jgi:hypothetical protein
MGVAPEAIAEMDFSFAMDFSPFYVASPRVEDEVNLCFLTDIFLFPALASFSFHTSFSLIR